MLETRSNSHASLPNALCSVVSLNLKHVCSEMLHAQPFSLKKHGSRACPYVFDERDVFFYVLRTSDRVALMRGPRKPFGARGVSCPDERPTEAMQCPRGLELFRETVELGLSGQSARGRFPQHPKHARRSRQWPSTTAAAGVACPTLRQFPQSKRLTSPGGGNRRALPVPCLQKQLLLSRSHDRESAIGNQSHATHEREHTSR